MMSRGHVSSTSLARVRFSLFAERLEWDVGPDDIALRIQKHARHRWRPASYMYVYDRKGD